MSLALGCNPTDADQAQYPQQPQAQPQAQGEDESAPGMYQNAPQIPEQPYAQPQQPYAQPQQPYAQPQPQQPYAQPQARREHLGIAIQPMTGELRTFFGAPPDRGVLVAHVAPGSAAEQAGLRVGDVLVFVGGRLIEDVADVRSALAERTDPTLRLDIVRRGQPMQLQAALGPRSDQSAGPMM